jgi:hypothetical protein
VIISNDILEKTCKGMIENILFCLSDANKGTIYRVGPMPMLQAVRITSGARAHGSEQIQWGLPETSDYNFPGKTWEQYCDRPGHIREAMGWCVERQKSWTADNPYEDLRSVRKQLSGEIEDSHHMEPVLVRKADLYWDQVEPPEYPLDHEGKKIWRDSEYVVVAVIKIHFKLGTIKRSDHSTKIIKKLSQTLGTELLSLHIRETLSEAQEALSRQRLQSCNVLAHEMRNTLVKLGFIFSAVNAEIGYLREQWEAQLEKAFPEMVSKKMVLARLSDLIQSQLPHLNGAGQAGELARELLNEQQQLTRLPLLPHVGEKWVNNRIRPKWCWLLTEAHAWEDEEEEIRQLLDQLGKVIWIGMDKDLALRVDHLPPDLRTVWPKVAYTDFKADKMHVLEEIMYLLDHPALDIPHQQQTKKILTSLKALVEMIPELEERANRIIYSLKNGSSLEGCSPDNL